MADSQTFTEFKMISLPNMEYFDNNNPWTNITFHREHRGKKFKFVRKGDDNLIQAKLNELDQHILLKQVFESKLLSKVIVQFTLKNRIENSIIGLLTHPLKYGHSDTENVEEKEINIKEIGLFGDKSLNESRFTQSYYGVGTPNGNENKFRIWRPNECKLINKDISFKDGDKLIFVFDFGQNFCKVYVNEMNDKYLICDDDNSDFTFCDIPQQFVMVYGAHSIVQKEENKKKNKTTVEVKMVEVAGKGITMKRKKRKKVKRRNKNAVTMKDKQSIDELTAKLNETAKTKSAQNDDEKNDDKFQKKNDKLDEKQHKTGAKIKTSQNKNNQMKDDNNNTTEKEKGTKQKADTQTKEPSKNGRDEQQKEHNDNTMQKKNTDENKTANQKRNKIQKIAATQKTKKDKTKNKMNGRKRSYSKDKIDTKKDENIAKVVNLRPSIIQKRKSLKRKQDKLELQRSKSLNADSSIEDDDDIDIEYDWSTNTMASKNKEPINKPKPKSKLRPKRTEKKKRHSSPMNLYVKSTDDSDDDDEDDDIDVEYDWSKNTVSDSEDIEEDNEHSHKKRKKKKKKKRKRHSQPINRYSSDNETSDDNDNSHSHHHKKKKKHKKRRKSANSVERESRKLRKKERRKSRHKNKHKSRKKKKYRRKSAEVTHRQSKKLRKKHHHHKKDKKISLKRAKSAYDSDDYDNEQSTEHMMITITSTTPSSDIIQNKYKFDKASIEHLIRSNANPPPRGRSMSKPKRPKAPPPSTYILKDALNEMNEYQMDIAPMDECYVLSDCLSIKRIKKMLSFYQKILNKMHNKNEMLIEYVSNYKHLLNDYHHILRVHLCDISHKENNARFGIIHALMTENAQECDLQNCACFGRNNRNKEDAMSNILKSNDDEHISFWIDMLDTLHITFVHSYDAGFRLSKLHKMEQKDHDNDSVYTQNSLKDFEQRMDKKQKYLSSIRGSDRMKINKFCTDFRSFKDDENENLFPYDYGYRCYYWDYYRMNEEKDSKQNRYCDVYISAKYENLKNEILQNRLFALDKKEFDRCSDAAQIFLKTIYIKEHIKQENEKYSMYATKELICSREGIDALYYGISEKYHQITFEHILSVLLYTNYNELNAKFRGSFKKLLHRNESDFQWKERHREYANWSRLLRETIEIYGEWMSASKEKVFYTAMAHKTMFNEFDAAMSMPISTSTQLSTVAMYTPSGSSNNGYVLSLSESTTASHGVFLKFFDAQFFSFFGFENEKIFIGGWAPLRIASIICLSEYHNYECFVKAMHVFECLVNGKTIKSIKMSKNEKIVFDKMICNELNISNDVYPNYPMEMFHFMLMNQKNLKINCQNVAILSDETLEKYFISSPNMKSSDDVYMADIASFGCLTKLCSKCESVCVEMKDSKNAITQSFLSLLLPIIEQLNKESNVDCIQLTNIRNLCSDKEIKKFKSYLNKHKIEWIVSTKCIKDKYEYTFCKKDKKKKKKFFKMFGSK